MARIVTTGFEVASQHETGTGQPDAYGYGGAWTDGIFDFHTFVGAGVDDGLLASGAGWWSEYSCAIEGANEAGWDLGADKTEIYGSFYFRASSSTGTGEIFAIGRAANSLPQGYIALNSGSLAVQRGATVLATGPILQTLMWYQIEFRYVCDQTTGRWVVKVDGDTKIDYTGDTAAESTANFRYAWFLGINGPVVFFDDVIINDTSGAVNTSWVGDQVVVGLSPSGSGDSNDLDPGRGTSLETTFQRAYFTGHLDDTPDISPAPDGLWNKIDSYLPINLHLNRENRVGQGVWHESSSVTVASTGVQYDDVLMLQAISPPLAAQTISGTFKCYLRVRESLGSLDARSQIVIRVVSSDGATVRGTLYAGDTGTGAVSQEWVASSSTFQNASFPRSLPASISSLAISAGDRLVVEIGYRAHAASSEQGRILLGLLDLDEFPLDIAENETDQGGSIRGWLEFSSAISLAASSAENYRYVNHSVAAGSGALLRSATLNETDLYAIENSPGIVSAVSAVAVSAIVRKTQPGTRSVALPIKNGGTQSDGPSISVPLTWFRAKRIMDVDPSDSGAWTTGKVDSLQIGVKVK